MPFFSFRPVQDEIHGVCCHQLVEIGPTRRGGSAITIIVHWEMNMSEITTEYVPASGICFTCIVGHYKGRKYLCLWDEMLTTKENHIRAARQLFDYSLDFNRPIYKSHSDERASTFNSEPIGHLKCLHTIV